LTYL
jgi:S-adenosylmethionine synthetase